MMVLALTYSIMILTAINLTAVIFSIFYSHWPTHNGDREQIAQVVMVLCSAVSIFLLICLLIIIVRLHTLGQI